MRDIKYRQPIYINNEFKELHYWGWFGKGNFVGPVSELTSSGRQGDQFTGLIDKEGTEIYEGDLLAFDAREWHRPFYENNEDYIFQVDQSETGEWVGAGICTEWPTFCKVVGNVYENGDLLTK